MTTSTAPTAMMGPPVAAPDASGISYQKDIRPLITANCSLSCHGPDAKLRAGPFALDTYTAVKTVGSLVSQAVMSGKMPPWPESTSCREMRDAPKLTMEQRQLFAKWEQAGFPEGSESQYVAPPQDVEANLGEPSQMLEMGQPHTPPAMADQYYCGKVNFTFPADTYIRAIEVIPDQKSLVHHVQVHINPTSACANGDNIYSWRPGGRRLVFSDGDAALVRKGQSFSLQMHYNTFGKTVMPDQTKVALWTLPEGMKPKSVVSRTMVFAPVPTITPGSTPSTQTTTPVGGPGVEIIGISPHAHMIAKHLKATLNDGTCLSDVQDWNFEWQLDYMFKEPLKVAAGASVTGVCQYDNTPSHQPTVDGVKRMQAITVTQGEGSSDEMCLHYVWVRRPAM